MKRWFAMAMLALTVGCASDDAADHASDDTTTTEAEVDAGAPVPSAGCGTSDGQPGVEVEHTINVRGAERRYLLTTPSAHDGETPLPVVFDFHGLLEGAEVHATMSQWSALAEEEGVVAVFPHGTGDPIFWDFDISDTDGNDDLAYTDAVLAELGDQLCIDQRRIYATGLSNGAMFTSALLCARAEVIAAAAPVAGLVDLDGCNPARPVPVLTYHGTADPILLFNGGVDLSAISGGGGGPTTTAPPADLDGEGYPAAVAAFAERNGCDPEPTDSELADEVLRRVYDCPEGADVEFLIIEGGGHAWPSSEFSRSIETIVGPTTFDVDGTRDSWQFLEQFHLP
ncbi:MAG: PHB depolymerase family esterase [Acidimicrobiales bacterium]